MLVSLRCPIETVFSFPVGRPKKFIVGGRQVNLLSNPWLVGIVGGIISGFIVTYVSRKILSKKDKREYLQKVYSANRELIFALRPGVAEGVIPSRQVVFSVTNATARKYEVDPKDLYASEQIAEELIKEIMDSSFISAETKEDYCGKLKSLLKKSDEEEGTKLSEVAYKAGSERYRSKMVTSMSMMLGLTSAMFTFIFYFFDKHPINLKLSEQSNLILGLAIPAGVTILVAVLSILVSETKKEMNSRRKDAKTVKIIFTNKKPAPKDSNV